jgi:hypothetical protein
MITAAQIHGYPESSGLGHRSKEGRVQLYPNLTFNGQCETAFTFYEECLHGRTVFMMTYQKCAHGSTNAV